MADKGHVIASAVININTPSHDDDDFQVKVRNAVRSRIPHFQKQADSLTMEGVRRLLEKDLELEEFAMDTHKRFVKKCFAECIEEAEDDNVSDNCGATAEIHGSSARGEAAESPNGKESKNHVNECGSEDEEKMEESPVLGLLTSHKTSENGSKSTQSVHDEVVLDESMIKKAIRKRVSYIKTNLETMTMAALRRVLEGDLKLENRALDPYKAFISKELDEVLEPAQASENSGSSANSSDKEEEVVKPKKKTVSKRKTQSTAQASENSGSSANSSDKEEEVVKPKKKTVSKRKTQSTGGLEKRKRPENDSKVTSKRNTKSKKTKLEDTTDDKDGVVDSEDNNSQSSAEKPVKKKEVSAPVYGKHVERLKSVIKACGLSVPPNVYKKVKQAAEEKREARLIKELEEILSREGLSSSPSEKEIKDVRKKKEKAKELEGIDTSNIISSSRRRSTISFVPPPKPQISDESDTSEDSAENDDDDDDDDVEDNDVNGGVDGSESEVPNEDDDAEDSD